MGTDAFSSTPRQGIELDGVCDDLRARLPADEGRGRVRGCGPRVNATPIDSQLEARRPIGASCVPMRRSVDAYRVTPAPDSTADVRQRRSYPVEREIFPHGFPHGTLGGQVSPSFPPSSPTHSDHIPTR